MNYSFAALNFLFVFSFFSLFVEFPKFGLENEMAYAPFIVLVFYISSMLGWLFCLKKERREVMYEIELSSLVTAILIILMISSVYFSIKTSVEMPIFDALHKVARGEYGGIVSRVYYELPSSSGGSSGVYKLLSFIPIAILNVISLVKLVSYDIESNKTKISFLFSLAMITSLIKVLFTLDRISVVFIMMALLSYYKVSFKDFFKLKCVLAIVFFILVLNVVSSSRLADKNIFDFLFLYGRSGLENLELLTQSHIYTYGSQTLFTSTLFVVDRLFDLSLDSTLVPYVWNPAQSIYGHAYLDFGLFGVVFFFFFGFVSRFIESNRANYKICTVIYIPMIVSVVSGVGVIWFRGIEFIFVVMLSYFIFRKIVNVKRKVFIYD
ncbi:oligosaccharide repeat unit polymerase [Vibrio coralliilyticus]|uniref:oligosaccharide repeat unit polymerase n=1 Tax=Vibrio coralliilyticus TaxID=190893 RepID=UPI002FCF7B75